MLSAPIRLFLVDDHRLFLEAFATRLGIEPDLEVVGTATDTDTAFHRILELQPHIAVLDIEVPGSGSFAIAAELAGRLPDTRVAFLSGYVSDIFIEQMLRVRASGYLLKSDAPRDIIEALRRLHQGEMCFSQPVRDRLDYDPRQRRYEVKSSSCLSTLTHRQLDVLRHLARGDSVKQVARTLIQSERAVESQKYRIMQQLGIHDRVELARFAIREGLSVP